MRKDSKKKQGSLHVLLTINYLKVWKNMRLLCVFYAFFTPDLLFYFTHRHYQKHLLLPIVYPRRQTALLPFLLKTTQSNKTLMLLFKQVLPFQKHISKLKKEGKKIGFVPTMGALHQGHVSLIRQSLKDTDCTVSSIFVNPTQFNDPSDLQKYPRTPEKDLSELLNTGNQVLFMPDVTEVYPPNKKLKLDLDFGYLDQPMEGAHRPGHFAGVAQVVKRLLDIVKPHYLYMGQKDFQQFTIIQHMLNELKSPVKLIVCPIIRESDGLAMSSRNVLLTPQQRSLAPAIHQALQDAKKKIHAQFPRQIEAEALSQLSAQGLQPEYFSIVDGRTLRPVELFEETDFAVACTAVKIGNVRLIDNMILKEE